MSTPTPLRDADGFHPLAPRPLTTRRIGRLSVTLLALVLAAGACSSEGGDSSGMAVESSAVAGGDDMDAGGAEAFDDEGLDGAEEAAEAEDALTTDGEATSRTSTDGDEGTVPAGSGTPGDDAEPGELSAAEIGREIILTGYLEVKVDDVGASTTAAIDVVTDLGGFVFGEESSGGSEPRSTIVFKVLPADFHRTMSALGGVGELVNQSITADDVTERVVDLESRIEVTELGVERLRQALADTTDLEDFARIESQLLDRESELEVMKGQLRTLRDRIDLSTITLTLTQDRIENSVSIIVTGYEEHDDGASCNGIDFFSFPEGTDVTLCLEIANTGDQRLTDISVDDPVLDLDNEKLIAVFGDLDEPLEPGESLVAAFELTAERHLNPRIRVTAVPVDPTSEGPSGPSVSQVRNLRIDVTERITDPGFGDGFDVGKEIVAQAWIGAKVAIGALVPLLIFVPFIGLLLWLLRKGRDRRRARKAIGTHRSGPPPPSGVPSSPEAAGTGENPTLNG